MKLNGNQLLLSTYVVCGHFALIFRLPLNRNLLYKNEKIKRYQKWQFKFPYMQIKKLKETSKRLQKSIDYHTYVWYNKDNERR
nr:MAG TPA: hypothetical protein [Caudoviricetes sp.]